MQGDLISRNELIKKIENTGADIFFDLPDKKTFTEDDFSGLVKDALQAYRKMIVDMIREQSVAYDTDKVIEQLKNASHWTENTFDEDGYSNDDSEEVVCLQTAIKIVIIGGEE